MIGTDDRWLLLPTKDLYDTSLMLESVKAAKDLYDLGVKRMDDFQKQYGDFFSPIQNDVDYWYNNTTNKVRDAVNYLYANGIDPTRSMEGRAFILRIINLAPAADLAKVRQSADAAKVYLKNRAELQAAGKFSLDFENFRLDGRNLQNWDTIRDGAWQELSPVEFKTLHDFVDPLLDDMRDHTFDADVAKAILGDSYDPTHRYQGVTKGDAELALRHHFAAITGNPLYDYHRSLVERRLLNSGELNGLSATEREKTIDEAFLQDAVYADSERWATRYTDLGMTDEAKAALQDKYNAALAAREYGYSVALENLKNQHTRDNMRLEAQLANGGGDGSGGTINASGTQYDGWGAFDALMAELGNAYAEGYRLYNNEQYASMKNQINALNNKTFKDKYNAMLAAAQSGNRTLLKNLINDWKKTNYYKKAQKGWLSALINKLLGYANRNYNEDNGYRNNKYYQKFLSTGQYSVNLANRYSTSVVDESINKFRVTKMHDMSNYGLDLANLVPVNKSTRRIDNDTHYTGVVAIATQTNNGYGPSNLMNRLDRALRNTQVSQSSQTWYGYGTLNDKSRAPGLHGGIAAFGSANVVVPENGTPAGGLLKGLTDALRNAMHITKTTITRNGKPETGYVIPVTRVNYDIGAQISSANNATRQRIGGLSVAYSRLAGDLERARQIGYGLTQLSR